MAARGAPLRSSEPLGVRFLRPLLLVLVLAFLLAALPAAAAAGPAPGDLLLRYGARLKAVDEKYQVFQALCDLASDDQLEALKELRVSPSQLAELLRALQESMPEGGLDEEGLKQLKTRIQPRFELILGAETFDTLLLLFPTPQQVDRARQLMARAAATPEGQAAWQAANELRAALTPEQAKWLGPVLDLARPTAEAKPLEPVADPAAAAGKAERRTVLLRKTGLGDYFAEVTPDLDYGSWLPRSYRVEGADPAILAALASEAGLPVRVLSHLSGDTLAVDRGSLMDLPIRPISGGHEVWVGRLPARAVSVSPPVVELDRGRGRKTTAAVEWKDRAQALEFQRLAEAGAPFLIGGTCVTSPQGATLVDVDLGPWQPAQAQASSALLLQLSEEFLHHLVREYMAGNPDRLGLSGSDGAVRLRVGEVGLTLVGCEPGQLRLYGSAHLSHTGLEVLALQFEVVARAGFEGGKLALRPVPGSLQLRVAQPLSAAMPASWIATLERILGEEYTEGAKVPVPQEVRQRLLDSGLLEQAQLDGLALYTLPAPDRRSAMLALSAPASAAAPPVEVLRSRITDPAEFALAFSEEALNLALQRKVPGMLPLVREIPEDLQEQEGVRLKKMEIPELDLAFSQGQWVIRQCRIDVHWTWGLFSGVEPGIRLKATARVSGSGDPLKLTARLQVQELEFLSELVTEKTPEEQQKLKDKLIGILQDREWELTLPAEVEARALSPRARFYVTEIRGTEAPSELLIQGGLKP